MIFPSPPSELLLSLAIRDCCCELTTLFLASSAHTQSKSGSHVSVSMSPEVEPPCLCNTMSYVPIRLKDNQAKMSKHYQERNNCTRIAVSNIRGRDTGQITEKKAKTHETKHVTAIREAVKNYLADFVQTIILPKNP